MAWFGEHVLGKGVVYCKDTPNFIANRIGTFGMTSVFHWMEEYGVGVAEVDVVFGPAMGRPKSAVFRTADIVGLDTMAHVLATIGEGCPDDPWRDRFEIPAAMQALIDDGRLGSKIRCRLLQEGQDGGRQHDPQPRPRDARLCRCRQGQARGRGCRQEDGRTGGQDRRDGGLR